MYATFEVSAALIAQWKFHSAAFSEKNELHNFASSVRTGKMHCFLHQL